MGSPFVVPSVVRLPLPGGDWIDVKKELTYGEQQVMFAKMRRQFGPNEPPMLDSTRIGRARMEAFIVGWSFVDPSGQPIPVSVGAIEQLRIATANALRAALEEHEERVLAEQEAEKNGQDGANVSSPISPSVK